jgi:hypothetical protein
MDTKDRDLARDGGHGSESFNRPIPETVPTVPLSKFVSEPIDNKISS